MRYQGSSLAEAGVAVGFVTMVGGIGGNILGSLVSAHFEPKWRSAAFIVSAVFTLPGAALLALSINLDLGHKAAFGLLLLGQVFFLFQILFPFPPFFFF